MIPQEFNHIYYKVTKQEKGIKPMDKIRTSGRELKEVALQKILNQNNLFFNF